MICLQDYVATRWYRAPELCGSFFSKVKHAVLLLFTFYLLRFSDIIGSIVAKVDSSITKARLNLT